MTYIETLKSR